MVVVVVVVGGGGSVVVVTGVDVVVDVGGRVVVVGGLVVVVGGRVVVVVGIVVGDDAVVGVGPVLVVDSRGVVVDVLSRVDVEPGRVLIDEVLVEEVLEPAGRSICSPSTRTRARLGSAKGPTSAVSAISRTTQVATTHQNHHPWRTNRTQRRYRRWVRSSERRAARRRATRLAARRRCAVESARRGAGGRQERTGHPQVAPPSSDAALVQEGQERHGEPSGGVQRRPEVGHGEPHRGPLQKDRRHTCCTFDGRRREEDPVPFDRQASPDELPGGTPIHADGLRRGTTPPQRGRHQVIAAELSSCCRPRTGCVRGSGRTG